MVKEPKKLDDLFLDTLKDIYYAEKKILTALPKMAKAAQNPDLKAAFEKHEGETEEQVSRLEQVFASINEKPQGKKCAAIEGILDEGKEIMDEYKGSPALDAGLISAAQAVEHGVQQLLPDAPALPVAQPPPAGDTGATTHLQGEHLPGDATAEDEDDAGQAGAIIDGRPAPLAGLRLVPRQ